VYIDANCKKKCLLMAEYCYRSDDWHMIWLFLSNWQLHFLFEYLLLHRL